MTRANLLYVGVGILLGLAACAEKEQTAETRKSDTKAWVASESPHQASGWKAGDQASWEEQLRKRAQAQNEYNRTQ
jgi:hypothetical protein